MKTIVLALLLSACTAPYLQEGIYTVEVLQSLNTCSWSEVQVITFSWEIIHIDDLYGITNLDTGANISCEQNANYDISCTKTEVAHTGTCNWDVSREVFIIPNEITFVGTFNTHYLSCEQVECDVNQELQGRLVSPYINSP
jgi:hypothetical protein